MSDDIRESGPIHHPYQPTTPETLIRVRAKRGVCIGVGRNMVTGDSADLEPSLARLLSHIGAVEILSEIR